VYYSLIAVPSICSELPGPGSAGIPRPDKAGKSDETAMAKSPSDYGLLGRRTVAGNSRRTQSHSGANQPFVSDKRHHPSSACEFANIHGVDTRTFDVAVSLVDILLTLDSRVDTWRSLMSSSWRRVIDVGRIKKQRQYLKSNISMYLLYFNSCSLLCCFYWAAGRTSGQ